MRRGRGATFDYVEEPAYWGFPSEGVLNTGGSKEFQRARRVNLTIINAGAGDATVLWHDDFDMPHQATIKANSTPDPLENLVMHDLIISGPNINVAGAISWPEKVPPSQITISGTANVNVNGVIDTNVRRIAGVDTIPEGGGMPIGVSGVVIDPRITTLQTDNVGLAKDATLTSGSAKSQLTDPNGVVYPQPYTGGANCPATGVWHFKAVVTAAGTPININGVDLLPDGFSGTLAATTLLAKEYNYTYPVNKSSTYTVGAAASVNDGKVTAS